MPSSSNFPFQLAYVTDVEGNLDYFLRFLERSSILCVTEQTATSVKLDFVTHNIDKRRTLLNDEEAETEEPTSYFVFGGDVVDKGPGDIRLVRALVDFQRRYPSRVHLLVGNRFDQVAPDGRIK